MPTRRLSVLFLCLLLLGGLAATDGPSAHAEDPCGDVFDSDLGAAAVAWQDLCELQVQQRPRASVDAPTTLSVRLRTAATERTTPSIYTVRWDVDGCAHRLVHADALPDRPAVSQFSVDCDGPDGPFDDCAAEILAVTAVCQTGRPAVDVAAPEVVEGALTWELELTGDVADLAGTYPPGTELALRVSASSTRVYSQRAFPGNVVCGGTFCAGVGSDSLDATGQVVTIQ